MPPKHVAQTSTEAKKAYKKNGPVIPEHTHKQLQRGYELDQRATREREAEKRRRLAKDRREERERKEKTTREQLGVGLATQMIGYSHTQAKLKKGMEAFLGISKKKQDDERRKREEQRREEGALTKKLEVIAQEFEKELFDDDDDIDEAMLGLPIAVAQDGGGWVDEELDDDTLLEIHDLVMSDPVEEPVHKSISTPPRPATALSMPQKRSALTSHPPLHTATAQMSFRQPTELYGVKEDNHFTHTHGPVNRMVESVLQKVPGEIIELLSHDEAASTSNWTPAHGLLHKLNPIGLPPHRLRIKIGCVVLCLRDLNTSSQLSKSQHVRVLRVENERLECLTLDGQLAGTKTVITRVPFPAKYHNDDKFPFVRTQYPVRVAANYILADTLREVTQSGFKLPSIKGQMRPPSLLKRPIPPSIKSKVQGSSNPSFKLPELPASKVQTVIRSGIPRHVRSVAPSACVLDGWDDFLESGTQIARELSAELTPSTLLSSITTQSLTITESVPSLSTQDLDFSLDDLDEEPRAPQKPQAQLRPPSLHDTKAMKAAKTVANFPPPAVKVAVSYKLSKSPPSVPRGPLSRTANMRRLDLESESILPHALRLQKSIQSKSKRPMAPPPTPLQPAKKACIAPSAPNMPPYLSMATHTTTATTATTTTTMTSKRFSDFGMSTQEAHSFFEDDDEDFVFGSPPIAV